MSMSNGNKRQVAIKRLKPEMYHKYEKEFDAECKIMIKLKHDNIVQILGQCPQRNEGIYI